MLEVTVFICGAVVMILELVGSRILAPYFGTSIVVWTGLIGVLVGALSLGYWWGGRLADRKASHRLLSTLILAASLSTAAVAASKSFILDYLRDYTGSLHLVSTGATLLLLAPPSVLLGMVSPFAVRLKLKDVQEAGRTVGLLYAISSVGSIFGTFLAGFFLIAFFGSTEILFMLALVLAATSLLVSLSNRLAKTAAIGLFLLLPTLSKGYDTHLAQAGFFDLDTPYSRVFVYPSVDSATGYPIRVMATHPKAVQSAMFLHDPLALAVEYTRFYELAWHFKPDIKTVLMLGGGGYSFPKYALAQHPDVTLETVELDPGITALARRFFALQEQPRLIIHHQDARIFLERNQKTFDAVLVDVFSSHYSIPFHLATEEAVTRIHAALGEDGVALVNILSAIEGPRGRFLRAARATYAKVFPRVELFAVSDPRDGNRWQNVMLVALKSPSRPPMESDDPQLGTLLKNLWERPIPEDVPTLTDDFAPVDYYLPSSSR